MNQHIQHIEISNFKSIKDLKIDGCKKINIFAGKPNAGKSNILEALALLKVSNLNGISLKEYFRVKNFWELFYLGDTDKTINISTDKEVTHVNFKSYNLIINSKNGKMSFEMKIDKNDDCFDAMKQIIFATEGYEEDDRLNIAGYYFKDQRFEISLDKKLTCYGKNLGEVLFFNPEIREEVNKKFDGNFKLRIDKNSFDLNLTSEIESGIDFSLPYSSIADTLKRLVFYKTAIMSNHDSVLLFEEPEAHCFEPYILEFTNEVKYNENNNQFFMVTHSDFIIQEFLRDEESRNNLQIYLVNNVDGKTEVKKLDAEKNDDVYEYGMNVFFNFDSLWENN